MLVRKLIGEKCYLSPYDVSYSEIFYRWVNDLDVVSSISLANKTISFEVEKEIMSKLSKEHSYLIVDKVDDKVIGGCGFFDIDHINRTSLVGIIIGDKNKWDKGFATDALKTLCAFGFNYLNLHNIMLTVYSFNKRAIRCYEKVGFKIIGRRRQSFYQNGIYHDELYMDIISDEFKNLWNI
ncbi:MAG: GNAT family N-acetyltransferase [Spirochaetales bacterium]|jgi:RimJ/RimL family protein N-acetyltransferase|nr:GNAT family N-acetyltransferase [Exilispira sp.]NMC68274.1 GNAT family N-acetyltransferase [Spirochaetales bacterium]